MPVRIHPSYLGIALFLGANLRHGALATAAWIATLTAVILATSLAQAFAFRRFHHSPRIWLHLAGSETFVAEATPMAVSKQVVTYLAGPAAGALIAGFAWLLERAIGRQPMLHDLLRLSAGWTLFNCLPLHPLAGGKALGALLWTPFRAHRVAAAQVVSLLAAGALLVPLFYFGYGSLPAFALLFLCTFVNLSGLRQGLLQRADTRFAAPLRRGHQALHEKDPARAHELARQVLDTARSSSVRAQAKELAAWAYLLEDNVAAAERTLKQMPPGREPDPYLEGRLYLRLGEFKYAAVLLTDALERRPHDLVTANLAHAFQKTDRFEEAVALLTRPCAGPHTFAQLMAPLYYAGRLQEAASVGERWFAVEKKPLTAFNLGCTLARLGRPDEAIAWLGRAVEAGWRDLKQLDEDADLEPLRKLHGFHQVRAQLTSLGRATTG